MYNGNHNQAAILLILFTPWLLSAMETLFEGAVWNEEGDEQPSELRGILQYNNATGKL